MILPLENTSMAWAITGTLGSGKSLCAVATAVDALFYRHTMIVTNIKLDIAQVNKECGYDCKPYIRYFDPMDKEFDPFKLPCGSPRGYRGSDKVRVIVIIDECAEFFDQYSSAKDYRIQSFLSWLRHCSKRGQDVFLIVQSKDFINKSLRTLCARFVVCTNLSLIRLPVLHFRFLPNISVAVTFDRYGNRGGLPAVFLRQSRWGRFYDTAQQISTHTGFNNPPVASVRGSSVSPVRYRAFFILLVYIIFLVFIA